MRTRTRSLLGVATAALIGLTAALLGATTASASGCSTYYVSSVGGSDSNDGCSTSTPWQTLANVNATTFAAGNRILFAKGGAWSGALTPQGSGSSGNPIVVSSYGTGAMPIIRGKSNEIDAIAAARTALASHGIESAPAIAPLFLS